MWSDQWSGKTISQALSDAARAYGDREAFVFPNARVGFVELERAVDTVARAFLALGVGHGDRVAIWMAGYAEWAYVYFGLAKIGAIMVPLNTRYKPGELEYVLRKSEARVLVFKDEVVGDKGYAAMLRDLLPELESGTPGQLRLNHAPDLRWVVAIGDTPRQGVMLFSDLLRQGDVTSAEQLAQAAARVSSEDVALIQFTSGTTAFPKGAQLYQSAMLRGAWYCSEIIHLSPRDRFFSPQPLYHAGGSILVMLSPIVTGCTTIVQAYFDPTEAVRTMESERCTATMGHQPHFMEYLAQPAHVWQQLGIRKGYIFASPDVNRMVIERLGITGLLSPLGLTETHLAGTACTIDDPVDLRITTVGRPTPGVELQIRSPETQQPLAAGQAGEVCFRGWCIMKGYYRDPERTAEAIGADGWFRTGDLGILSEDGYLRLRGRIKDMIRVGGENVAAADVEGCLLQHPAVKQAVVVGRPDPRLGEVCVAFVELLSNRTATQDELIDYCRARLASFKVPRQVCFVREWPMTGSGKIQRYTLAEVARTDAGTDAGAADKAMAR